MPVLIAFLFVAYGVMRAFFGAAAFECVLDKALCYMLLFAVAIMEVLSELQLISGVRFFGKNIPLLEPRTLSWSWWTFRLVAFQVCSFCSRCTSSSACFSFLFISLNFDRFKQMVPVIAHCAPRGVGIGAAYLLAMREYFLVILLMGFISNILPRLAF